MQMIVLGMHRSGTSVLARVLNLMGGYFGPEGVSTGSNQENPKGFWERRDVRALNDWVLHSVGADWNRLARFDVDNLPESIVSEFSQRAARLVLELDAHRPWFLKEPRLCILLPLWLRVLEVPIAIHIIRHPVEVAASLRTRNGIPIAAGLALWEKHVRSAVAMSRHLPGVLVTHRQLVLEPAQEIARLHEELADLGVAGLRLPGKQEIDAFVSTDLYRERESSIDVNENDGAEQVRLFGRFKDGLPHLELKLPAGSVKQLVHYESTLPPMDPTPKSQAMPQSVDVALREKVAAREQEAKSLRESVAKLEASLLRKEERLTAELMSIGQLQAQAMFVEQQSAAARMEIGKLQAELERSLVKAAGQERELQSLQSRVATLSAANASAESRLEQAIAKAKAEQADHSRLLEKSEAARSEAEQNSETRFQELAMLTQVLLERETALESARKDLEAANADLSECRTERDTAHESLARMRNSRSWRITAPIRALFGGRPNRPHGAPAKEIDIVSRSGLFDRQWYLETYPDVAASGMDPIEHFLRFGAVERRNPAPGFDVESYLAKNPHVAQSGMNPLVHFIVNRSSEGQSRT